ncbi:hypothetical protein DE146DRAFT_780341 [Phaeosphaeria sp. MPI-PUGE-AT-0046c]|nr:hypothetical protein DE146DRAFT_780341 [Phaeosphaeria sp. MPI-PUGE-AT-0046c]
MASPRPPTSEMQSLFVEYGLPMEPKLYDTVIADGTCQIILGYYDDPHFHILGPIDDEVDDLPYHIDERTAMFDWVLLPNERVVVVWIENFFTDGLDFVYYIIGRKHLAAFTMATFNAPAYCGPIIATPIRHYNSELLPRGRGNYGEGGTVRRTHGHMERVKWKFLFETARVAWNRLLIDPQRVKSLRAANARILLHRARQMRERINNVEVQSITSTEARGTKVELSAKKKGKMRPIEIEEPSTLTVTPRDTTNAPDHQHQTPSSSDNDEEDRETKMDRLADLYLTLKNKNASGEEIKRDLTEFMETLLGELEDNKDIQEGLDIWTSEFKAHMHAHRQLDDAKEDPTNTDQTHMLESEERLEIEREELFASVQSNALAQFVTITGRSNEQAGRRILAQNSWDVQAAVAAHYDGTVPTADVIGPHTDQQQGNDNADEWIRGWFQARSPPLSHESDQVETGPSGIKNLPKFSKQEEEANLGAARTRFKWLIAQNDRHEVTARQRPDISDATGRQDVLQETILANARRMTGDTLRSLPRPLTGAVGKRPSFQTALDVIGSNSTRKRADITGATEGESPPKKRRDSTGYTAIQGGGKPYKVRFGTVETLLVDTPRSENTPRGAPSTTITSQDDLDYETKLEILQDMRLASDATVATVLFECAGNLERAVAKLGGQMSTALCKSSLRTPSSQAARPRSSIRMQSPEVVPAQPDSGREIDRKATMLRDMGFRNPTFVLVRALNSCSGSVEGAVEMLLTGGPRSPPNLPQQGAENIDPSIVQRERTPPSTYKGKGKGKAVIRDEPEQYSTQMHQAPSSDPSSDFHKRLQEQYPSLANQYPCSTRRPISPANFGRTQQGQGTVPSRLASTSGLDPFAMTRQLLAADMAGGKARKWESRRNEERQAESRGEGTNKPNNDSSGNTMFDYHTQRLQATSAPGSVRNEEALRVQREFVERVKQKKKKEQESREGGGEQAKEVEVGGRDGRVEKGEGVVMKVDGGDLSPTSTSKQVCEEATDEDADGEMDDIGDVDMGEE